MFGTKAGWERADHLEPGRPWRRAGRDQAAYGWTRPPWFDRVTTEATAVRERCGLIDLSSFGKIAVDGPGALGLLQRVSANDIDRPVGSVVYTPWCDERGGMVADVTVTRLGATSFRVVTGAGYVASDLAWLRSHVADDDVSLRDVSGEFATLGLWGPRARDVLAAATGEPCDDEALPIRTARSIRLAGAAVLASRISYAGELGWELVPASGSAVGVWDALVRAADAIGAGLEPFGYRALDSLRMEKGYRYYGTDMTMLDTPFDAGLGAFVRLEAGPFLGREALSVARERAAAGDGRRLRTIHAGTDGTYLPVYGGEAVRAGGEVVGRLRSVAYGPAVGATIGYVYLDRGVTIGTDLELDVFDGRVPATVVADVSVDPRGTRMAVGSAG